MDYIKLFLTLSYFLSTLPPSVSVSVSVSVSASVSLRFKAAQLTDKRVKVMNEVITGIRVIKMYAWEYAFKDLVAGIRKYDLKTLKLIFICIF